jgi:hypothetical protein
MQPYCNAVINARTYNEFNICSTRRKKTVDRQLVRDLNKVGLDTVAASASCDSIELTQAAAPSILQLGRLFEAQGQNPLYCNTLLYRLDLCDLAACELQQRL